MSYTTALIVLMLLGLTACGFAGKDRGKIVDASLGSLGSIRLPDKLQADLRDGAEMEDWASFAFRRTNSSHLNGQTSYRELMQITVFAEDLEVERMIAASGLPPRHKDQIVEEKKSGDIYWKIVRIIYERHPVEEPAWRIDILDLRKRVALDWVGWQKHYSLAEAKQYMEEMLASVTVKDGRAAFFAGLRDWPAQGWQENYVKNLRLLGVDMPEGQWRTDGPWRYAIEGERPRRFVLAYRLAVEPKPDGPVSFDGPVTKYIVIDGYLRQDNQGHDGGILAESLAESLIGQDREESKVHYYSIQTVNLWKENPPGLLDAMKRQALELERQYRAGTLVTPALRR